MKFSRPVLITVLVCCTLFLAVTNSGQNAVSFSATISDRESRLDPGKMKYMLGNSYIPREASEVLRASHEKYLEGCILAQRGESEKARDCFNEAVDLLMSPDWDMAATLHLNHFFQELIQRIPERQSSFSSIYENGSGGVPVYRLKISPSLKDEFVTAHLAETSYEIPITVNKAVAKSIYYWLNDGRRFFIEGLVRSGQYRPIIERIFREESVPVDLMYLAQVESLFKPTAFSKARAKGIWQFNKSTARQYGLRITNEIDERSDPEKSTRAAARYLKDLHSTFGDWNLALAAYNWGAARVKRLVQQTGSHDFWELVRSGQKIPQETKNHIPLIHASIILARNPEIFDLPTMLDPFIQYVEVSVPDPVDLRSAATILNTTVEALKQLNPSLTTDKTPANYPDFRLKVPAESDVNMRERLVALSVIAEPYS